jgi:hypothetical protein
MGARVGPGNVVRRRIKVGDALGGVEFGGREWHVASLEVA